MTTAKPTEDEIAEIVARLEQDLAALPGDEVYQRQLDDLRNKRESLAGNIVTIHSARTMLAGLNSEIAACTNWLEQLTAWRKTVCEELLSLPTRNDRDRGKRRNLELSLQTIDSGLPADTGWELETLRLGQLMREAGYVEGLRVANQIHGPLPWHGSLPTVEKRLKELAKRRDDARARLERALQGV